MGTSAAVAWAFAGARRAGPGKESCQDAFACATHGDTLLAAVADGAGSARFGALGARFACESGLNQAMGLLEKFGDPTDVPDESLASLVPEIRRWLTLQASQTGAALEDLATTLLLAMSSPRGLVLLQVGDGACVVRKGDELSTVRFPDQGEYANATFFVTGSNAEAHTHVERVEGPVEAFAMFTDGLQYLVLDAKTWQPHTPFFTRVFDSLNGQNGESAEVSAWLDQMLSSDSVTSRTDDDTSLVIARRVS